MPDPFCDRNETACAWMEEREGWFRLRLDGPEPGTQAGERRRLVFPGLDPFATIWLDGEQLGTHENMFRPAGFDLTERVKRWVWRSIRTANNWPKIGARSGFGRWRSISPLCGGGICETCDRLGMLVGEDVMFARAMYPEGEPALAAEVEAEARSQVRRFRSHPCLALWCGNTEDPWLRYWDDPSPPCGALYYNRILPVAVADLDGWTPYWPGPLPVLETLRRVIPEDQLFHHGPAMDWHNTDEPKNKGDLLMEGTTGPAGGTMEYLHVSQLAQVEGVKFGIEHFRRRKPHCLGTLVWQLNDC